MDKKLIVKRIEELMRERGISNYELKENAEISSTIYQWKKNAKRDANRTPSLKSIEKICGYLGVSLSYFFAFDKEKQREIRNKELVESIYELNNEQIKILELLIIQFKSTKE